MRYLVQYDEIRRVKGARCKCKTLKECIKMFEHYKSIYPYVIAIDTKTCTILDIYDYESHE